MAQKIILETVFPVFSLTSFIRVSLNLTESDQHICLFSSTGFPTIPVFVTPYSVKEEVIIFFMMKFFGTVLMFALVECWKC